MKWVGAGGLESREEGRNRCEEDEREGRGKERMGEGNKGGDDYFRKGMKWEGGEGEVNRRKGVMEERGHRAKGKRGMEGR